MRKIFLLLLMACSVGVSMTGCTGDEESHNCIDLPPEIADNPMYNCD